MGYIRLWGGSNLEEVYPHLYGSRIRNGLVKVTLITSSLDLNPDLIIVRGTTQTTKEGIFILIVEGRQISTSRPSAHQKFKALAPEKIGHNKNAKLPLPKVLAYPELKVNPFGDRICRIFSSSHDGDCTFEDFLDMMSVFSDAAPKAVKAEHAFRIFDFDGDDMLGVTDLRQVVDRLTGPQRLAEQDMQHLIQNILDEADLDDDGALSFAEFEHIISKSSDFANAFRIRL
uniref:EF-hand domain-containing protein n=1 Tax=Timema shepardi TaxID=629360 RepID=A0A7R9G428_TIMSH|nr:unnamed protein product [Timema shepardi]